MKLKLYLLLTTLFLISAAMTCGCGADDYDVEYTLVDLKLTNLDNSGENIVESEESIKKEAFAIGLNYGVKDTYQGIDKIRYLDGYHKDDFKLNAESNPKVYCLVNFDEGHPAGSDVSEYFKITTNNTGKYNMLLLLMKAPSAGEYAFRVEFQRLDDRVVSRETVSVTLF